MSGHQITLTMPDTKLTPAKYAYLHKICNGNQSEIARTVGKAKQTINDYYHTHRDDIDPLLDNTDQLLALTVKGIAIKSGQRLEDILSESDGWSKKDLMALNVVSGTHIDKHRLFQGQSTANISVRDVSAELSANLQAAQERLDKLKAQLFVNNPANQAANCKDEPENKCKGPIIEAEVID